MARVSDIRIVRYTSGDNESALLLEEQCVQGETLILRFRRPTFHARSEVYDKYKILCAKVNDRVIGIVAGAEKLAKLRGEKIVAIYIYDLRVHPEYRRYGIAKQLVNALLEEMGEVDCIYTLIAGQNRRALGMARRLYGAQKIVPLTYAVIPVYRRLKVEENHRVPSASEVHEIYLRFNPDTQFVPDFDEKKLHGYVTSIVLRDADGGGFSIWTNENLLAEQVIDVPLYFRMMRALSVPFRPFLSLPHIPKRDEIILSWFLFDFCATDQKGVHSLLSIANNIALDHGRTFLYILLGSNDTTLRLIRNSGFKVFMLPYVFLAKGRVIPAETDRIYIDVRDL